MKKPVPLHWRPQAQADLLDILEYIAEDDLNAADALQREIDDKTAALPQHPKLYKLSARVPGMRELVIRPNYVVFYRESAHLVEIVNVVHARRQWPPIR
jgi:addiction module RelE/StbE family toxin